ncbi:phospholipase A and acyltransferase 3-like [Mauremys reevesii]|uniref:phospholipase A and acyltransferase 3-like n=1 Tax=Mauremys reevesii TaxID=260615 RepID=UPI00193ED588|nr:phospholipase A and acyltransferase 3-like [Mauremys reevesii]XP_039336747.1 phospholipase A and acyltransferase 3-like [Mauremys reevesii]XP_039336748.1 phospholipase A and acyltransferase 3-like [Mauremys reevesii]
MPLKGVEPKPGDLIEISRFAYRHWALYVGYGYVIHLAPPSEDTKTGFSSLMSVVADKAVVRKEPLWAVVKDDDYWVNNKHDRKLRRRSVDQIIQEAESLVWKTMPYSVTSANCEHFVTKLRYGVARSDQVRDAMVAGVVGIMGVGALVAAATVIGSLLSDNKQEDE